ncbi:Phospholipase B1, membrane-associated [Triplophysa tibetana]|uniref:Phospholipase B1, membrane-associated n=1 Tax=Triplophysa tibetana TaxID=1572043 RepID=A0A5A9NQC8_9TELE|nr:Phospholipase B1, membrane-associated [Triplophysa tibetana]
MFSKKVFCGATSPLRPPAITAGHALQREPGPVSMKYPQTSQVLSGSLFCTKSSPSPSTPISVHVLRPADVSLISALVLSDAVRSLMDQAEVITQSFSSTQWNLLLFFVPVEEPCVCKGQDLKAALNESVSKVENELDSLHKKESLGAVLENRGWFGEREDFSVMLQSRPVHTDLSDPVLGTDLTCEDRDPSPTVPTSVHALRPADIKVVAAMGDSLTAGNGVGAAQSNLLGVLTEYRGLSWCSNKFSLFLQVPRAMVNLVELLHLVPLRRLHQDPSIGCPTWLVNILCPCVLKPKDGTSEFQKLQDFNKAYQHSMNQLVESGRYDTHENFTVVLQPFLRNVFLPVLEDGRPDRSYFSPDCFHLGQKAHTLMARALWNNMLEPLGNKTDSQDFTAGISVKCPEKSAPYLKTYHNSNYTYETMPPTPPPPTNWGSDFSCVDTAPSESVPTSVHMLRPGDINVVASVGDSITAGFGAKAKNLLELSDEERGVSWSIGGDNTLETVSTVPNILKNFNPNVFGFSLGKDKLTKGFNVAVSGAKASNIPVQVRELVTALSSSNKVNFENDWKLVTLFIGGNDLCQFCHDRASLSPQKYIGYIQDSLDILYKEVPRVLVNFVEIFEIKDLRQVKRDTLGCSLLQENICPCFLKPGQNSPELTEMTKINRDLQTETERLVYGGRYDGREDFTVVLQPFFKNSILPLVGDGTPDLSFFSVDCFHFTERGHAEMAISLWNNMLEPVGSKQTYNNFTYDRSKIHCPTKEHPFIFTLVNSVNSDSYISTTVVPTTVQPGTPLPPKSSSDSIPAWGAAVLAVGGLLIGWAITWIFFYYRERRSRKRSQNNTESEMKGTQF